MGKRIGYARVSTDDQNLDLQRDALALAGCSVVYEETMSGKSADRPELGIASKLYVVVTLWLSGDWTASVVLCLTWLGLSVAWSGKGLPSSP